MGWTHGVVGTVRPVRNLVSRLSGYRAQRSEREHTLNSKIVIDYRGTLPQRGFAFFGGTIIDEYVRDIPKYHEEGGTSRIEYEESVEVRQARFWITERSLVVIDKTDHVSFSFRILEQALGQSPRNVQFDVNRVAADYGSHWLGGFIDRTGYVRSGTLYGTDIGRDDEFGQAYQQSIKNQVGILVNIEGDEVKVRVTSSGAVTLYLDWHTQPGRFIEFILDEFDSYLSST